MTACGRRTGRSTGRTDSLGVRIYAPEHARGPGLGLGCTAAASPAATSTCPRPTGSPAQFAARGITVVSVDYRLAPLPPMGWAERWASSGRTAVHYPRRLGRGRLRVRVGRRLRARRRTRGRSAVPAPARNLAAGATLRLIAQRRRRVPALVVLAYPTLHAVQADTGCRAPRRARRRPGRRPLRPRRRAGHVRELPRRPGRRRRDLRRPRHRDDRRPRRASRRRS